MICKGVEMEVATMTREQANRILADFPRDSKTGQAAVSLLRAISILNDLARPILTRGDYISESLAAAIKFLDSFETK